MKHGLAGICDQSRSEGLVDLSLLKMVFVMFSRAGATTAALIVAASIMASAAQAKHAAGEFPKPDPAVVSGVAPNHPIDRLELKYVALHRSEPSRVVTGPKATGFDWLDAGIGAAVMLSALIAIAAVTVLFTWRRQPEGLSEDRSLARV